MWSCIDVDRELMIQFLKGNQVIAIMKSKSKHFDIMKLCFEYCHNPTNKRVEVTLDLYALGQNISDTFFPNLNWIYVKLGVYQ